MEYSKAGYGLFLSEDRLRMWGKLEEHDYTEINCFLKEVDRAVDGDTCIIDLRELEYLNSSGIKAVFDFMRNSAKKFEIYTNQDVAWQKRNIPLLVFPLKGKAKQIPCKIDGFFVYPKKIEKREEK